MKIIGSVILIRFCTRTITIAFLLSLLQFNLSAIAQQEPRPRTEQSTDSTKGKKGGGKKGKGKRSSESEDSSPETPKMETDSSPVPVVKQKDSDPVNTSEGIAFFEAKIRPALVKYCYECHSEAEGKSKGGLLVDSQRTLAQGGENGPAVVPGDLTRSLLVTAVQYDDPDFEMPPKGKLPASLIADFEKWIEMGAPDPRIGPAPMDVAESGIDIEKGRQFWSFKLPVDSAPPKVNNQEWPRTAIDQFILASLTENKLAPATDARPETLVRRLYFVLCGLPPSPEDTMKWGRAIGVDLNQDAIAQLVDSLLSSPRFGERWGQHWLDVARYADSTGGDSNNIFPEAWRYRDYVIEAFNLDKPYDQFIREQLAGDLLKASSPKLQAEQTVATGFLAIGQKLVGEMDSRKFEADLVDEQLDATSRAFLGLTVACARCHDHKSDPIPQSDYYALAAFFKNTQTHYGLLDAQARQSSTLIDVTKTGLPAGRARLTDEELAQLRTDYEEAEAAMDEVRRGIRDKDQDISRAQLRRSRTKIDRTEAALKAFDRDGNPQAFIMGVGDRSEGVETRLLVRGEVDKPGPVVEHGFLQVATENQPKVTSGSGRLELSSWIADHENPLTSRVMVNRIWHWLFGQGLVRSTDDFGATGESPSHPELLDHLSIRFVENGWSVKKMIREIVMSRTWQQTSSHHAENFQIDPDNRYLWRANQRRLEAESIRDAFLTVAGNIQVGSPQAPLLDSVGEGTVGQNVYEPEIRKIDTNHRSIYLPRVRNVLPESLALFDAPDASNVTGAREVTTGPLQALFSLNHPFVHRQAEAFAALVSARPTREQIDFAYLKAYGRFPTDREEHIARRFVEHFQSKGDNNPVDPLIAYCHAMLCSAEFTVID